MKSVRRHTSGDISRPNRDENDEWEDKWIWQLTGKISNDMMTQDEETGIS